MDDRIREAAPYEAPKPTEKTLDQATSHLQMLGAIDLDGFNQWVIHNPGGVCVLMQALLDRLPIPTREAMIQSITAQSVAQGGEDFNDTERRADGQLVSRKRWEEGFRHIVSAVVGPRTEFEIPEIVELVRAKFTPAPATGSGGEAVYQWQSEGGGWRDCSADHWRGYANVPKRVLYTHPDPAGGDAGEA